MLILWNHKMRRLPVLSLTSTCFQEINAHLYGQYVTKEAKTYSEAKIVYLINGVGKIG